MRIANLGIGSIGIVLLGTAARAQLTLRVSVDSSEQQGNGASFEPALSADGRFVAFESGATNLVPGDVNGFNDIFVRDRLKDTTERVSIGLGGAFADAACFGPSISADGRFVAFMSRASNLVPGDTNGRQDVFVRDRASGTTERVSLAASGGEADGDSFGRTAISAEGRFVGFYSYAANLVLGDTNGCADVFVRDRQTATTDRVSVDSNGVEGNQNSLDPQMSSDGRFVVFTGDATNLVPGDTNALTDVFVRDRQAGTTVRVSVDSSGVESDGSNVLATISGDGRFTAFSSVATNLVAGDTNGHADVFLHDLQTGATERISVDSSGVQGDGDSGGRASICADARFVAFMSLATNMVPGDTNGVRDVFIRDRADNTTTRVSVGTGDVQGVGNDSRYPSISADGRYLAFQSGAANLTAGDTNAAQDIFARDRAADGFVSFCDPGQAGVIACPCSGAPAGPDQGCPNSSGSGGASLLAAGVAYLSLDRLNFLTLGEPIGAASVVVQGDLALHTGGVFGQGVRCVGGHLKRLYVKFAVGGSIVAPEFLLGDPDVSTRSAALGDTIHPGDSRFYAVYYRDPVVPAGCAATSTFNVTQSGRVTWWP